MEQQPSDSEQSFFKTDRLPISLAGISSVAIIASGLTDRVPTYVPLATLMIMIGTIAYAANNEIN